MNIQQLKMEVSIFFMVPANIADCFIAGLNIDDFSGPSMLIEHIRVIKCNYQCYQKYTGSNENYAHQYFIEYWIHCVGK